MRNFCIALFVGLALHLPARAQAPDSILVMFWNLENFFDYTNQGTGASDLEFSSHGARHWTKKRFYSKCSAIAKTIYSVQDVKNRVPDIIAFAEIENRFVLEQLLSATQLKKCGYRIIHQDSPDPRGIDVAVIYRKDILNCVQSHAHIMPFPTRDMVSALFVTEHSDSLAIIANHHPSKYSGAESEVRRRSVVRELESIVDSLAASGWMNQIALGDFNEQPDNLLYQGLSLRLHNLSLPLMEKGIGSIRFNGSWELIDLCFVSDTLYGKSSLEVYQIPFLTVRDSGHAGYKPLRTYSGPKYLGGVSDHYPILLSIAL